MPIQLITCVIAAEQDVVHARQRARIIAAHLGLNEREQVQIATAVSELVRNAFRYATGGTVRFAIEERPTRLLIEVRDQGPGIRDLQAVLDGSYRSNTGMGMGIMGARRLMDDFELSSSSAGTTVRMSKYLPKGFDHASLPQLNASLAANLPGDPNLESLRQNHDLMQALAELQDRQLDLERLNEELEETNRGVVALYAELDARAVELRRASERKSRFLSHICHELRSPLNAILALVDLLAGAGEPLSSGQEKHVRYIRSAASGLQSLVNELLDVARIEAGKVELRPEPTNVASLFTALRQLMQAIVPEDVELVFADATGCDILTDVDKLTQVLRNYLSNPLKFTESGTVTVSCEDAPGDSVRFMVQDTGIGIPQEQQVDLFTEFYQVRNPLQGRHKGSGLGLARCRALADLMGGRVGCDSRPGSGSCFWIELPRALALPSGSPDQAVPRSDPALLPVVLLTPAPVDPGFHRSMEQEGLQVLEVTAVDAARELTRERQPLALALDLTVTGARDLVLQCRSDQALAGLPMICISQGPDLEWTEQLGVFAVVPELSATALGPPLRKLLARPRILIVDDDPSVRAFVRSAIREAGAVPLEAENLGTGWTLLIEQRPQLLILDLVLPDGDGVDLLIRCRNDPELRDQRIVIFSSLSLDAVQRQRLASAEAILAKDAAGEAVLRAMVQDIRGSGAAGPTSSN